MSYKQLSYEQRVEIRVLLKLGYSRTKIAGYLGVHKSTVSRELSRNVGQRGYRPKQAQISTEDRRRNARKHVRFTDDVRERVVFYLKQEWSPEQISGYLAKNEDMHICHETIYQYVWADKQAGGEHYKHLRHAHKKRKKRYGKNDRRGQIKDRISIDERPKIVDTKERFGDWEIDTIIGRKHQGALISAVERKSHVSLIEFVPKREADLVAEKIIHMLKPFKNNVFTITVDNGKEFAQHKKIARDLETDVYFAHPYSSWERGLNENMNGLIRQYFPKKYDFNRITKNDTLFVENRLNHRPRKSLNFLKPCELFTNSSVALGT